MDQRRVTCLVLLLLPFVAVLAIGTLIDYKFRKHNNFHPHAKQSRSSGEIVKPHITGAVDPAVSDTNVNVTICIPGYSQVVRPSSDYTNEIKTKQIKQLGYSDTNPHHYEEDHLIPLELGGAPRDVDNLWPEPRSQSEITDPLENRLHKEVCSYQLSLSIAQRKIISFKQDNG